jgi:hypothetical protein
LEEFQVCLSLAYAARLVAPQTTLGVYEWRDDGKRDIDATIHVRHTSAPSEGGTGKEKPDA